MDSGLEHPFDLGLVNYHKHPTNQNFVVYRFKDIRRANHFEELLVKHKIWYERANPEEDEREFYLFAIEKKHFNKTQRLNYQTEAKFKKPLIKNQILRYLFVSIMLGIVGLAIAGYCTRQKELEKYEING